MDKKTLIKIFSFPIFILIAISMIIFSIPIESSDEKFLLITLIFSSAILYTIVLLDL